MPGEAFRVVTPDVGGGFGMKIFLYAEQPLVLLAARDLGRPVKWTTERSADDFVSDSQGRDNVSIAELALDDAARFTGLRVRTYANMDDYPSNSAPYIPPACSAGILAGVYRTPTLHVNRKSVR